MTNLERAQEFVAKAKEAEARKDWLDALACWDRVHDLAIGYDLRDEADKAMIRVRALAAKSPKG